ncbi:MAG: hypothetical protein IKU25_05685 [Clostridia bacterium]|nr:hypothetical protein [Clostridia bacterium]
MKVIFLDVDGVLNSWRYDAQRTQAQGNIDRSRLVLIKWLVDRTDAKIVLSSTWRHLLGTDEGRELEDAFRDSLLTIYDVTPDINNDRPCEIKMWLSLHPETEKFVIIDDIKMGWGELDARVIKTDYRIGRGVEERHVRMAAEMLKGEV